MGYELTGRSWDPEGFESYLEDEGVNLSWAKSVTVHHTASPSLAQRPRGFIVQHMRNLQHFYEKVKRWSAGPHLFTDEDQVFGLSSLYRRGVHARSFNKDSVGIEALGDYDTEDPLSGRGLKVWQTTAMTVAILLKYMNLPVNDNTVKFHRDDPKTSKTCPGTKVTKQWFLSLVNSFYKDPATGGDSGKIFPYIMPDPPRLMPVHERIEAVVEELNAIKKIIETD